MRVLLFALLAAAVWSAVAHPWGWAFAAGVHPYPAGTPWTYQLLSGFLPALTVLTLLGSIGGLYHLHNCHAESCWRLGKHRVNGTPWCSRHQHLARTERTELAVILSIENLLAQVLAEVKGEDRGQEN